MPIPYVEYEIPLLTALIEVGGSAKARDVYPVVEKLMKSQLAQHPEEYEDYRSGGVIWKNKIQWAREYLKKKGQLDPSVRGVWTITGSGKERIRIFRETGRDSDEGLAKIHGLEPELELAEKKPEETFRTLEAHETGDILGIRGIVYEPINEQGVILLFAALAYELDYRIEAIRIRFPDALLKRKNQRGNWVPCKAEFEFRSSDFKAHGHNASQCDLIICWKHDWQECPIEVLELSTAAKRFR
jgi:hypothetical protein